MGISADLRGQDGSPVFGTTPLALLQGSGVAHEWLPPLARIGPAEVAGFDALYINTPRLGADAFANGPGRLRIVARHGVGYDSVDIAACSSAGVVVTIQPDAVRRPLAVAALTLVLALSQRLLIKDRLTRAGEWDARGAHMGGGLVGRTLGVVGLGNVGQELLGLAKPFGLRLLGCDPFATATPEGTELVALDALLEASDYVVLLVPLTPQTRRMIDGAALARMRQSAYLINLARGPVVDEAALLSALRERRIAGAGLDVFEQEPIDPANPLLALDNVIVTPHALCWTDECFANIANSALQSVLAVQAGTVPAGAVNPSAFRAGASNAAICCGRLSATLMPDGAGLRDIAYDGEVILRGLAFVVRDTRWSTYALDGAPSRDCGSGTITLVASGRLDGVEGDLNWRASFVLGLDGIEAVAEMHSQAGFATNRAGLVVLHAIAASRGQTVRIGHPDGKRSLAVFPDHVAPHQLFSEVVSLDHGTPRGVGVRLTFEGEVFETEDQRNWTDASFKTYGRPLALGYPYRLAAGERTSQRISLRFGDGPPREPRAGDSAARVVSPQPVFGAPVELPHLSIGDWDDRLSLPFADRNRQQDAHPDWTWGSCPTMHGNDDDTIGESVEALADLIATAKARDPSCRIRVQPIRLRSGSEPDGREGSVIEAAWILATITGYLDQAVVSFGFDEPKGASRLLLDRLLPHCGRTVQPVTWRGLDRLKGLQLNVGSSAMLAIAHLRHVQSTISLPPGEWTRVEWLRTEGFDAQKALSTELAFDGFCVGWLSGRKIQSPRRT